MGAFPLIRDEVNKTVYYTRGKTMLQTGSWSYWSLLKGLDALTAVAVDFTNIVAGPVRFSGRMGQVNKPGTPEDDQVI